MFCYFVKGSITRYLSGLDLTNLLFSQVIFDLSRGFENKKQKLAENDLAKSIRSKILHTVVKFDHLSHFHHTKVERAGACSINFCFIITAKEL